MVWDGGCTFCARRAKRHEVQEQPNTVVQFFHSRLPHKIHSTRKCRAGYSLEYISTVITRQLRMNTVPHGRRGTIQNSRIIEPNTEEIFDLNDKGATDQGSPLSKPAESGHRLRAAVAPLNLL